MLETMTAQLAEVEEWVGHFRERLAEERSEVEESREVALRLTRALLREEEGQSVVPSHLSSLFPEDPPEAFFPFREDGGRRERLARERRNEYNAFLRRKEESEFQRREVPHPAAPSRSILESVDYEKILAKRKAEEAEYRNLNRAEPPPADKSASTSLNSVKKYTHEETESVVPPKAMDPLPERNSAAIGVNSDNTNQLVDSEKKTYHAVTGPSGGERRGGGGDPLRDSSGNLITTRGFVTFPSERQNALKSKQVSYREELRQQIEEKRLLEEERRRKMHELEEQEERRSEEQRLRMQREYEEEQARTQRKSEQRDRDRLRQLEDFQVREAALRQKRAPPVDERVEAPVAKEEAADTDRRSPPIPVVRSKVIIPPPLLAEVKPENVFSSISEIRRSLMQEQPKSDFKNSYEVMNRRTVLEDEEEFE